MVWLYLCNFIYALICTDSYFCLAWVQIALEVLSYSLEDVYWRDPIESYVQSV